MKKSLKIGLIIISISVGAVLTFPTYSKNSSTKNTQINTIVETFENDKTADADCKSFILQKSIEGYKVVSVEAYSGKMGKENVRQFFLVMEK